MRVPQSKRRYDDLKSLKFYRGWLTIEERLEMARLGKQLRQQDRRRERYHSDPEYRRVMIERGTASKRVSRQAQREART